MHRSVIIVACVVGLGAALFACRPPPRVVSTATNAPPRRVAAQHADDIEVWTAGAPDRPYVETGFLEVHQPAPVGRDLASMVAALRVRAAEMGCDGIVITGDANVIVQNGVIPGYRAACIVYRAAPAASAAAPTATAAAPTDATPQPPAAPPNEEALRAGLRPLAPRVQACFAMQPDTPPTVRLRIGIASDGRASYVGAIELQSLYPGVVRCLRAAVDALAPITGLPSAITVTPEFRLDREPAPAGQ